MGASITVPTVGDRGPTRSVGPLTRTDIVRYAGASGDFNPIHHDDGLAVAAGFPTVFSIGMLQAGILGAWATDWLGADHIRHLTTRFREQVWPGDILTFAGTVVAVEPHPEGGHEIDVELSCTRQTGGVAVSGTASFHIAS